jgi:hypothetical protein
MKLKKLSLYALLATSLVMASCDDDDDVTVDTTAPTVSVSGPVAGAAVMPGDMITVAGTVTDNDGLKQVNIAMNTADGTTAAEAMATVTGTTASFSEMITVPAAAMPGAYNIVVTAMDITGNVSTAQTISVTVEAAAPQCEPFTGDMADMVQIAVTTPMPVAADENLHIVGDFQGWDPGATDYMMTRNSDQCFSISLPAADFPEGSLFKFALGSWDRGEKTADCQEVDNRTYSVADFGNTFTIELENFKSAGVETCDM